VIRSVKPRDLLDTWLRALDKRFKIANLMGIGPRAVQKILVRAVIDQDIVRSSTPAPASEDIIELG
jgi:hypothetical protein